MRWSLRIGRVFGIALSVHATFVLLLLWLLYSGLAAGKGWTGALGGVGSMLAVFTIVVLHELGHALTARGFGVRTTEISLLPIGGVATMDEIPRDPRQELLIAVAGPAVNVALAILAFSGLLLSGRVGDLTQSVTPLTWMFWVNVGLASFNMLPAFPMDGGRVLRAFLTFGMGRGRATAIAAAIGQGMSLLFALGGLFFNPMLLFIALFVWVGAESEAAIIREENAFANLTAGDVMAQRFDTVTPDQTLYDVLRLLERGFQTDVPVLSGGQIVGMLSTERLAQTLALRGGEVRVMEAMRPDPETVDEGDSLVWLMRHWHEPMGNAIAVTRDGVLVGLLTPTVVGEHVLLRTGQRAYEAHTPISRSRASFGVPSASRGEASQTP